MTNREIALLRFLGGGSVQSPSEKQEAARIVQLAMRAAAQTWIRVDANSANLQQLALGDPAYAGGSPGIRTLNAELGKAADPSLQTFLDMEARVIRAHDPVVVFDREHDVLVTEQTLRILRRASTWAAKMFQIPAPDGSFLDNVRQAARSNLKAAFEPIGVDGFVHIERDFPYAVKFFAQAGKEKTAAFFRTNRPI